MFTSVRRRLTLWYVGVSTLLLTLLLAVTFALITHEVRAADDLELRLRAERLVEEDAVDVLRAGAGDRRDERARQDDHDDDEHDRPRRPESLGTLAYVIAPDLTRWAPLSPETLTGLPDLRAAQSVVANRRPAFSDLTTEQGALRLYNVPVRRDGETAAVIQVARSSYFTARTLAGFASLVGALGATGLALTGLAGYWLAGRAMQPIAIALQRQRDFVADASHELRTPLTLLRANAEVLARHPDESVAANLDLVQDLIGETDRLSRLVADLLTLARADSGQAQVADEVVDLSALALQLCREIEPLAAVKGLDVTPEIAPGVVVRGDPDRLRQLGLILLENAVRYTAAGRIVLQLQADDRQTILAVQDSGTGIGPEHLPHIFERFYRADPARGGDSGGTGLGLAIARWIAAAHGGQLTVASTPGRGSTFTVHLPTLGAQSAL